MQLTLLIPLVFALITIIDGILDSNEVLIVMGFLSLLIYWPLQLLWEKNQTNSEQLQKIQSDSRAMLNTAHDMMIEHTLSGNILGANEPAIKRLGYNLLEIQSLSFWDLDEDSVLKKDNLLQKEVLEGSPIHYETEFRDRNGNKIPVEIRTRVASWMDPPRLISVVRDISEWRNTEKALEESRKSLERSRNRLETRVHQRARELKKQEHFTRRAEKDVNKMRAFLHSMIDSMPSIIIALDLRQKVSQWNRQAEEVTGISSDEAIGRSLKFLLPEFQKEIESFAEGKKLEDVSATKRIEGEFGGEKRLLDVMVYPLRAAGSTGVVVRVDDVTEKSRIEDMLIQTEKMLSLGGLAAGMAHEINNPLGAILQSSQNLRRRLGSELKRNLQVARDVGMSMKAFEAYFERQKIVRFLNTIDEAGKRAAAIVEDMLSFAKPAGQQEELLDIREILDASVRLAQSDYSTKKNYDFRNITIIKDYAVDIPIVEGRKTRLQQVFLNLLTNSAQALSSPEILNPSIILRLYKIGTKVVIEIADNGPGISDDLRHRIFDPFFTTKSEGAGTGLGLSVSYFIITKQMKGAMEAFSEPDSGARFMIRLPIAVEKKSAQLSAEPSTEQFSLPLQRDPPK